MTAPVLDSVPVELRSLPSWVVWRAEQKPGQAKLAKVPYSPATGQRADSSRPETGTTFEQAVAAYQRGGYSGVGLILAESYGLTGVDLDGCLDGSAIQPWAAEIVAELASYTEVSPSGMGLRIFCRGKLPPGRRKKGPVELYETERFLTVTGRSLEPAYPLAERQTQIEAVHAKHLGGGETPATASHGASGPGNSLTAEQAIALCVATFPRFSELWDGALLEHPSRSEAELAIMNRLAWATGGDPEKMLEAFRESGHFEEKCERTCPRYSIPRAIAAQNGRFYLTAADAFSTIPVAQGSAASPVLEGLHIFHDVDELPAVPMAWRIEDFIPRDGLTLIFGESGSFKSFTGLDMVYHIAAGRPWCGREVQKGPCLVVVGEGSSGIRARGLAWKRHHGVKGQLDVFYCAVPIAFSLAQQVNLLRQQIQLIEAQHGPLAALVVDTLAQCFGPGDENSAKDMAAFIQGVNAAMGHRGARIVVHHTGHNAKDRARGAYALPAALDASFQVQRVEHAKSGPGCILECRKQRDAEMSETLAFATLKIELGLDAKGRSVTSLVLEEIPASDVTVTPAKLDDKQRIIVSRVRNSFGTGVAMTMDSLVAELVEDGSYARASTARRAIERLIAKRALHLSQEGVLRCF